MKNKVWLILSLVCSTQAQAATQLRFTDFLNLVKEKNTAIRASANSSAGALLRQDDGALALSPILSLEGGYLSDKRETTTPSFQGTSTQGRSASASISKLTTFGMSAKFSYGMQFTDIVQASLLNPARYYTAAPSVEIRQSLWRNGFGSETRALQSLAKEANLASGYGDKFKNQVQLIEAQNVYWRLTFAKQLVNVQKEVLDRSKQIVDWAANRAKMQLGERTDLLQAEAALQLRQIELRNAQEEERAAAAAFNAMLERPGDTVPEILETMNPVDLLQLSLPLRQNHRSDIQAALAGVRLAAANAQIAKEKASPSLDIFATHSWNGKDTLWSPTASESLHSKYPLTTIGVKFSTPLDIGLLVDVRRGASQEAVAAELLLERKVFEENRDWLDLERKFADAKARLALARNLEHLQEQKMTNEQDRLRRGRSTTYQTLLFEQDFVQAQALRIRIQSEIVALHNQLKLFSNDI